jgi:hypothetical protein
MLNRRRGASDSNTAISIRESPFSQMGFSIRDFENLPSVRSLDN